MIVALQPAFKNTRRGTFTRGTVLCPTCKAAIHLRHPERVDEEFSARCPGCGRRSFHHRRDMTIEQLVDRRKKPRPA
jgi:DNA-directed RNA polymerase subunit RPC12/RpoP